MYVEQHTNKNSGPGVRGNQRACREKLAVAIVFVRFSFVATVFRLKCVFLFQVLKMLGTLRRAFVPNLLPAAEGVRLRF